MKYLYNENFKLLKKEMEKTLEKEKKFFGNGLVEFNIVRSTLLPKDTYKLNAIPIKIPISLFIDIGNKAVLQLFGTTKDPRLPAQS